MEKEQRPEVVEAFHRNLPGVKSALYTPETGSLLLHHDVHWNADSSRTARLLSSVSELSLYKKELQTAGAAFLMDFFLPASRFTGMLKVLSPSALTTLYACRNTLKNGVRPLQEKTRPNADTLSMAAIIASIIKGNPKSAVMILIMSTLSEIITDMTSQRTKTYVRDMMSVDTPYVWKVIHNGREEKVPIQTINPGDTLAVFEGEKISADGRVCQGTATIDQSAITGEYMPQEVFKGQEVYAGTIVQSGSLQMEVTRVGEDTTAAGIIHMIEHAQDSKAPIQNYADDMSERLVPVSFLLALLTYALTRSWDRVLNMLVIDYVCGIKLATATAVSASIGRAASQGAIMKGGQHLQSLASVDTAILDKTGTITEGRPEIVQILPFNGFTENDILRYAASAEEHSSHPIAESILTKMKKNGLTAYDHDHSSIENIVGHGVRAIVNKKEVLVGSQELLIKSHVDMSSLPFLKKSLKKKNTVYAAVDQSIAGVIVIEDAVRSGMKRTINQLRRSGIDEIVMITGDKKETAEEVFKELHLDHYYPEVLPHEKAAFVHHYKNQGRNVMMVGDGINDAPALAAADIGVSMGGKRTDIAVEASDLVITSDDPLILADMVDLSKSTMRMIRRNFAVTIALNSAAILFGLFGWITPTVGAAIHNSATIGVVLNSTRLLVNKERKPCRQPLPSSTTYLVDSA
ncbi:heavy metal translocating P-type ATPase [Halobacillus kuroshimensis]|uniref:heavy metal translocating P-type ATPase n=1 Tax=Halobacillus kuroshimensis TaxID=302481 RepID=UPI000425F1F8|nr:cation-translocating P-type ATPase [Halobacillus kuroshimensis]